MQFLRHWIPLFTGSLLLGVMACQSKLTQERPGQKLLIISDHFQQEATQALLQSLSQQKSMRWDSTRWRHYLQEDSLLKYSAVILVDIALDTLQIRQQADLRRYVESGGGLLGINATLSTPYTWAWWSQISQPSLDSSPDGNIVAVKNENQPPGYYWQSWGRGRIGLGTFSSADLNQSDWSSDLLEAIAYGIADNRYDFSKVNSPRAPEDSRFTIKVLDTMMFEPMELVVMPNGNVLYIERRGKMKCYFAAENRTRLIHEFDVCTSGNYEDGLLGLALDPHFSENSYLYLYYSPGSDCERPQTLSRFTMLGDSLIVASEKIVLEVGVQRETCCHSGGSVTFDPAGNLWLSTGDNTSSKESNGYTPTDERPGRGPFDAQKSSGNTHDLRGKILRIKPNAFGAYDIPDGNLFPKDGSQGRPEIYIMGARNPFRIAVDPYTGYVYWGDVGPDAGSDSKYGPESFDEWNQARSPGNYGWPYFMGDNKAFPRRDFDADTVGPLYDPARPLNTSPNNTGAKVLPPARPAFIWYSKRNSKEFPQVGRGSNSAMAGPIYYQDRYPQAAQVRFPAYYTGKWFIYEWARSWIQVVSFDSAGDLAQIESFLPKFKISKPIDMEFGPDGAMYMLEYGRNYFADNPDARLVRIEYAEGNREPIAQLTASHAHGAAPLTVDFSAEGSFDYDPQDSLQYEWYFTGAEQADANGAQASWTYSEPGIYEARLKVIDHNGASTVRETTIQAGNASPQIAWTLSGNRSFFEDAETRTYAVKIADQEDGVVNPTQADVRLLYLQDGSALDRLGVEEILRQGSVRYLKGQQLIANSDCSTCHDTKLKSVGPSYEAIADRYRNQFDMVGYLADKIIVGGNGNWGDKLMAGHPQLSLEESAEMVRYILSLDPSSTAGKIAPNGQLELREHQGTGTEGRYLLTAAYTDQGANGVPALQGRTSLILQHPKVKARDFDRKSKQGGEILAAGQNRDVEVVKQLRDSTWLAFDQLDLTGIDRLTLRLNPVLGGQLSVRIGSPHGQEIGRLQVRQGTRGEEIWREQSLSLNPVSGFQDLYLVFLNDRIENWMPIVDLDWIYFHVAAPQ